MLRLDGSCEDIKSSKEVDEALTRIRVPLGVPHVGFRVGGGARAGACASDNKIALIPGGPHPYFAPWEQAAADAKKDFGIAAVDFKVPTEWKLDLQTELLESLAAQGYNGFGIFPATPVGINSTVAELDIGRHPVGGARRLHAGPDRRRLLPRHRRLQLGLSRHQGADQGDGRQGQHRPSRRPPRRPEHHAPRQGGARPPSPRPTAR